MEPESCNMWLCSCFTLSQVELICVYFLVLSLKALEVPGVKVLRFESSLYFGNVERFRSALFEVTGRDPGIQPEKRKEVEVSYKHSDGKDKVRIPNEVNSNVKINKFTRRIEERMDKRGKSARMTEDKIQFYYVTNSKPNFAEGE